jgi:hypothetical protein
MKSFRPGPIPRLGLGIGASLVAFSLTRLVTSAFAAAEPPTRPFLVRLVPGSDEAAVPSLEGRLQLRVRKVYRHALRGFAADLTSAQVSALRSDPRVADIGSDGQVALAPLARNGTPLAAAALAARRRSQEVCTGVRRVGADRSPTARINGIDEPLDIDIAVLDTGIDPNHPDLNVAGGVSFLRGGYGDPNGHGTHVAGIIGARDNTIGVVGVAPGARLWAVRVLNKKGFGSWSDIVDGVDWVAARAGEIEIANLSLSDDVASDNPVVRAAFDGLAAKGVTIVAAAGNGNSAGPQNASFTIPARYDSVIAVSALADNNGQAGPSNGFFKVKGGYLEGDESYADFSNYGTVVDLIAPGVSIVSTFRNRKYGLLSGTSQAAPHVTGAAALYKLNHPTATPAQIRIALRAAGSSFVPYDAPDASHEPALDASGL